MRAYAHFALLSFLLLFIAPFAHAESCSIEGACVGAQEDSSKALFSQVISNSGELGIEMISMLMISLGVIIGIIFVYEKCRSKAVA